MSFTVTRTADAIEGLDLRDEAGTARLVLAPARGGMATRLILGKKHLFYLDEATLRDPSANVRGGNPVLFPTPGKLEGDRWQWRGKSGALKQHGFARNEAWEVVRTGTDGAATATLRLASSDRTRANYPWDFVAEYTYSLTAERMRIDLSITCTGGDGPMPFGAGFHPYFHVKRSEKRAARVETNATKAFDNVSKKTGPLPTIDLGRGETDLHFVDHQGDGVLKLAEGGVRIRASAEFGRWVVWTVEGKDFVCLEPWTCPGNALNSDDASLLVLAKDETKTLWVEYARL